MEYGEAINSDAFARAITIAHRLRSEGGESVQQAATDAVAQAYCVCVTEGEDAAEHRFSDVHRKLIDDVAERLRQSESAPSRDNRGED